MRHVLLRGSIVTWSSLEALLKEASPAFVLGACSHGLSLMVTNCLMMPLPEGTYAQWNRSQTLHSSRKVLNRLLLKAVSLSVRISVDRPCS